MENALTLKFYQRSVSSVNNGTIRKDTVEYPNWKEKHICAINHTGSAVAMEIVGLKRIFHRSERLHNLRYTFYVGDGDTKHMDMGNFNLFLLAYFVHMSSFVLVFCNFAFFQFLVFQKG